MNYLINYLEITYILSIISFIYIAVFTNANEMKINSFATKLYCYITGITYYKYNLPKDICNYFVKLLMYSLVLPITFPIILLRIMFRGLRTDYIYTGSSILFWLINGTVIASAIDMKYNYPFIVKYLIAVGVLVLILASTIGIMLTASGISNYIKNKKYNKSKVKKESVIKTYYRSWKERVCVLIKWN